MADIEIGQQVVLLAESFPTDDGSEVVRGERGVVVGWMGMADAVVSFDRQGKYDSAVVPSRLLQPRLPPRQVRRK